MRRGIKLIARILIAAIVAVILFIQKTIHNNRIVPEYCTGNNRRQHYEQNRFCQEIA